MKHRSGEKGAVSIEVLLAVLPVFLAMFFATYVGDFMNRRAGLERVTQDALNRCSRGLGEIEAQQCVLERLTETANMCATVEITPEVETLSTRWNDENLAEAIEKELSLLRADVTCSMEFSIPLVSAAFDMDLGLDAQTQAAMPLRLDTEVMP